MQQYRSASPLTNNYLTRPIKVLKLNTKLNSKSSQKPIKKINENSSDLNIKQTFADGYKFQTRCHHFKQQGLFINNHGPAIVYQVQNNRFLDYNYFFFPQGITIKAKFNQQGKLQNWCTIHCEDKFTSFKFYKQGSSQRAHYLLNLQDATLIKTTYERGKLIKIQEGNQKDQIYRQQLNNFNQQLNLREKPMFLNHSIQQTMIKVSDDTFYYGNSVHGTPNGYGLIINQKQRYYGYFEEGILNGIGTILFPNGICYYGQIFQGLVNGYGKMAAGDQITYINGSHEIQQKSFEEWLKKKKNPRAKNWINAEQMEVINAIHNQFFLRYFSENRDLKENIIQQKELSSSVRKQQNDQIDRQSLKISSKKTSPKSTNLKKQRIKGQMNSKAQLFKQSQGQNTLIQQNNKQIHFQSLRSDSKHLDDHKAYDAKQIDFFANKRKTDSLLVKDQGDQNQIYEQLANNAKLVKKQAHLRKPENTIASNSALKKRNKIFSQKLESSVNLHPSNYFENESELNQQVEIAMIRKLKQ